MLAVLGPGGSFSRFKEVIYFLSPYRLMLPEFVEGKQRVWNSVIFPSRNSVLWFLLSVALDFDVQSTRTLTSGSIILLQKFLPLYPLIFELQAIYKNALQNKMWTAVGTRPQNSHVSVKTSAKKACENAAPEVYSDKWFQAVALSDQPCKYEVGVWRFGDCLRLNLQGLIGQCIYTLWV
jgi:hypothetical protein